MKKTKNFVKHKKTYLQDAEGTKYAPFMVDVEDHDYYVADSIRALAGRNSGHEVEHPIWGTLQFEFFTARGVKTFTSKVKARYNAYVRVEQAVQDITYEEIDTRDL